MKQDNHHTEHSAGNCEDAYPARRFLLQVSSLEIDRLQGSTDLADLRVGTDRLYDCKAATLHHKSAGINEREIVPARANRPLRLEARGLFHRDRFPRQ